MKNILVTGGAGFIGSNFIRLVLKNKGFDGRVINFDKLTYAGNLDNLVDVDNAYSGKQYFFVKGDICDSKLVAAVLKEYSIDTIVNFAAESHVDRSIHGPEDFVKTNILGTFNLLESARLEWDKREDVRFHHISTDEVYGSVVDGISFTEDTPYDPSSPYSASKAASDHIVRAYYRTYGLPITISNCSNNYGSYQFPEKLIPLMILNALNGKPLPVYGDGKNVRDWLHVEDHCQAIWLILQKGRLGETYNIGGNCQMKNLEVIQTICNYLDKKYICKTKNCRSHLDLITFVADRPGHDRIYAIDSSKIMNELDWSPTWSFDKGIEDTLLWYVNNKKWVERVKSGKYLEWVDLNYSNRSIV